ncbi:MAG: hypothetical protein ABT11_15475 [Novosphingobium sp. SCN 66-18]|nr:MAG: hypothetical protein ABT11_15475 [Novosphingobium sp. SCN 66-18]
MVLAPDEIGTPRLNPEAYETSLYGGGILLKSLHISYRYNVLKGAGWNIFGFICYYDFPMLKLHSMMQQPISCLVYYSDLGKGLLKI